MIPESKSTIISLIDLQERLCGAIERSKEILPRIKILLEGKDTRNSRRCNGTVSAGTRRDSA